MATEDGGLELFDLLYDRIVHLEPDEATRLQADDPDLVSRLSALMLFEGDQADTLRRQLWQGRRAEVPPTAAPPIASTDWSEAQAWPSLVAPAWRDPERLRRLAESRAAGRVFLELPGFVDPTTARRLAAAAAALPFERMETEWVQGDRRLLSDGELSEWITFLGDARTRRLIGGLLGRALPDTLTTNTWRLHPGDTMPVHPDGRRYHATVALGLCEGWTAADGGAIAMGTPTDAGFRVDGRWLPHLGDLLLFVPSRTTWHGVEPVVARTRLSVTGWWTER